MYRKHSVAVVMPAYNVADRIGTAVLTVPSFIDWVIVVDDGSKDNTLDVCRRISRPGLVVLRHPKNSGVGSAISTGYTEALRLGAEIVAVMAGDGQMDPRELSCLLDPIVDDIADYAKGNRFAHPAVWRVMPKARILGNIVLSCLTKITSGYWRVFDSQCGYTAISQSSLRTIDAKIWARYGYPNDVLARMRSIKARVIDIPVSPVYDGQHSGIRVWTFFYPILFVLVCSLARRLWIQCQHAFSLDKKSWVPSIAPTPKMIGAQMTTLAAKNKKQFTQPELEKMIPSLKFTTSYLGTQQAPPPP